MAALLVLAPVSVAQAGVATPALPNDPLLALGENSAIDQLHLAAAWQQAPSAPVNVAIVDSGIDASHPDLAGSLWTNEGEIPGNGIDDDGDGFVDDVHGWDFVHGDGTPEDDAGHGTHVAGIVAARGNNGVGIAGAAWNARVMALKVLDSSRSGTAADVAKAIRFAVAHGARVVNLSLNGPSPSRELDAAIDEARAAGVLIVASAGNDGRDIDAQPSYPASSPDDNVLTVASVDDQGQLSSFSNYGDVSIDIAAPGEGILSTAADGRYESRSGTSMAAAEVTGVLALMAEARPDLSAPELRDALLAGVSHPGPRANLVAGQLDALGALRQVVPPERWRDVTPPAAFRLDARRRALPGPVTLRWQPARDDRGVARYRVVLDGRRVAVVGAAGAAPRTSARVSVRPGRHVWQVIAFDAAGNERSSAPAHLTVARPRPHR